MIHRQSTIRKIAIGIFLGLFIAGWALPDVFAAGLGSGGKKGGSSSSSSSGDRGVGNPIISEKSSSGQPSSTSSPTSSGQSSTTPLSTPSDSQASFQTYTQPGSAATDPSYQGSVGMEATGPGSKKKKAGGGGFPPVDTSDVKASETADTAMAIRGKPAHSEDAPTKGSDVAGGGSSGGSGGPSDLERLGRKVGDVVQEGAEGVKGALENLKDFHSEHPFIWEGAAVSGGFKDTQDRAGKQVDQAGRDIGDESRRAPQNIKDLFSGKNISDKQLRENIEAGGKEAGKQLDKGAENAKVLWDLLRGHDDGMNPIWEGVKGEEKWFRDTGAKIDKSYKGSDIYKGAKQLEEAGKKVGDTLGKTGKDAGDVISDAGDKAGDALKKRQRQGERRRAARTRRGRGCRK